MKMAIRSQPTIIDVAAWFLLKEAMTHKKLQKLCYYAEAWSEALLDEPICYDCDFEAWVHGPVNVTLWNKMKPFGWNIIEITDPLETKEELKGKFDSDREDILTQVWSEYGTYTANDLECFTHQEKPWLEQREGLGPFETCTNKILVQTMKDFYGAIADEQEC